MITDTQVQSFMEHIVWKELKKEMQEMRNNILENLAEEENIDKIRMLQGMQQVLMDLQRWPEMQLETLQQGGTNGAGK